MDNILNHLGDRQRAALLLFSMNLLVSLSKVVFFFMAGFALLIWAFKS